MKILNRITNLRNPLKPLLVLCGVSVSLLFSCDCHCDKTIIIKETIVIKDTVIKEQKVYLNSKILPCPICGAKGYLHQAVNDIEHPAWTVDCSVYDKKGYEHERVGKKWQNSKLEAISVWNNAR